MLVKHDPLSVDAEVSQHLVEPSRVSQRHLQVPRAYLSGSDHTESGTGHGTCYVVPSIL